jgi:hypothetical protein
MSSSRTYSYYGYDLYNNHTLPMVQEIHRGAVAQASLSSPTPTIERLGTDKKTGDLWIRSFLLNTRLNKRGWMVDPNTIRDKVLSIIGKNVVIDRDPISGLVDHPEWDSRRSAEANYKAQSRKAIGTVERVFYDKETDSYYADSKIHDRKIRDYINSLSDKHIPIPVSPQLVYDARKEQPNFYSDYELTHLALVHKGAYGPQAKISHVCSGTYDTCNKQFQNTAVASASSEFVDKPGCYGIVQPPSNCKRRGCVA